MTLKEVVLEVRRTMTGWIVETPGGEEVFSDGGTQCYQMSVIHTDVHYEFMQEDDGNVLVVRLRKPIAKVTK